MQAPDYSTKVRTLTPAQSQQSLRAKSNLNLASHHEVHSTAAPVEAVQNPGTFSRSTSLHNVQQAP